MIKTNSSPQLFSPASGKGPCLPAAATVSAVDKATCQRAMEVGARARAGSALGRAGSGGGCGGSESDVSRDGKEVSPQQLLRNTIRSKRQEIQREQDKLSSSLTTPLCKSEMAVLQDKHKWMSQVKDLNQSYDKIPPISKDSKSSDKGGGRTFYVDM